MITIEGLKRLLRAESWLGRRDREETFHLTDEELRRVEREAWDALPQHLRSLAVQHLRQRIPEEELIWVGAMRVEYGDGWPTEPSDLDGGFAMPFHSVGGMAIRNLLREVVLDQQLPGGNWDDYYVPAIEEAAGCRPR